LNSEHDMVSVTLVGSVTYCEISSVRVHLSALGCRLNEAELEQWAVRFSAASHFSEAGDTITSDVGSADVMVMNTCAVTREAVRKSRQKLQRLQRDNPGAKLVVSGCYSSLESPEALAELGVDLVVPNTEKDALVLRTRQAFASQSMPASATLPAEAALFTRNRHRAFIKIQDGCRYRCTFCIVTVARGSERSRSIADICTEVNKLFTDGIKEIVLTGVHVGGYGSDIDSDLASLVQSLLKETDMPRIRFASVEPWDLSPEFLELFTDPRIQPHMHLPLQSGSDTVLRRMARRCKTKEFAQLTAELRQSIPCFNITTDIIAGFPGETDEEWRDSLDFIQTQRFGHIHAFTYSEREGTKASTLPDPVPPAIRQARNKELHDIARNLKAAELSKCVGQTVDVLWERGVEFQTSDGSTLWKHSGYTPNYFRVETISTTNLANEIQSTHLTGLGEAKSPANPDLGQESTAMAPGTAVLRGA